MDIHKITVPVFFVTLIIIVGAIVGGKYHESQTKHVYIPTVIEDNQESQYLLNQIHSVAKGDKVIVHINSRGGDAETGKKIRDAIKDSEATIVGEVDGMAASAGADIMLDCKTIRFENTSTRVLFHVSRYYYIIDSSGNKQYVGSPDELPLGLQDSVKTEYDDMNNPTARDKEMYPRYDEILNDAEMYRVFVKHEDFWLSGVEVAKRLKTLGRNVECGWKS